MKALELLSPAQTGDLIYLITDGGDNRSKVGVATVKKAMEISQTRLFTFLISDPLAQDPAEILGVADISDITKFSGGDVFEAPGGGVDRTREAQLKLFFREMFESYVLTAQTDFAIPSSRPLKVEIVDTQGNLQRSAHVVAPRTVGTCKPVTTSKQ